jgi:hypothetical protein
MKVTPASSAPSAAGAGSAKATGDGFRLFLAEGGAASRLSSVTAAGGANGVSGVSALLALQGVGGPEARDRALRKGRRILDALDRLQLAVLGDGPTKRHLTLLQGALSEQRDASGDSGLDETLNWAEVRAAVEAAKLERAADAA